MSMSAAQRVFSTPELVAQIIEWVASIWPYIPIRVSGLHRPSACATLARCARINSLWFHEAQRHLWQLPNRLNAGSFRNLSPSRRQIYAHFVKHIFLFCEPKHHGWLSRQKKILKGVTFPNARSVNLEIPSFVNNPLVSPFYAPAVEILYLHVHTYVIGDRPAMLEPRASHRLARSLKVCLPLSAIVFTCVNSSLLQKLLPGLKKIIFSEDSCIGGGVVDIFIQEFPSVDVSIQWEGLL